MKYRCANDLFSYCADEPEWEEKPSKICPRPETNPDDVSIIGGSCRLDPKTCGKYQTMTEHYAPTMELYAGMGISEGSYRHATAKNGRKD